MQFKQYMRQVNQLLVKIIGAGAVLCAVGIVLLTAPGRDVITFAATSTGVPTCNESTTPAHGIESPLILASAPKGTVLDGEVFCRLLVENYEYKVNKGEIGDLSLIERDVIQAVDVYGQRKGYGVPQFNNPVFVCLRGSGSLHFLDATQAPRKPSLLAVTTQASYTCGVIERAGLLVLTTR
jgi:hypothetical protein